MSRARAHGHAQNWTQSNADEEGGAHATLMYLEAAQEQALILAEEEVSARGSSKGCTHTCTHTYMHTYIHTFVHS